MLMNWSFIYFSVLSRLQARNEKRKTHKKERSIHKAIVKKNFITYMSKVLQEYRCDTRTNNKSTDFEKQLKGLSLTGGKQDIKFYILGRLDMQDTRIFSIKEVCL